jgi:hypothetical protein
VEPISPELALIDPELRRRHLALLPDPAPGQVPPADEPAAAVQSAGSSSRLRLGGVALIGASLFLNGYLVAHLLARDSGAAALQSASVAFAPPLLTGETPGPSVRSGPTPVRSSPAPSAREKHRPVSRVSLERQVLSLVLGLPAKKVPKRLSGGVSMQSICERDGQAVYTCIVRPAQHKPGEGLTIRYVDGRFKLAGYRSG